MYIAHTIDGRYVIAKPGQGEDTVVLEIYRSMSDSVPFDRLRLPYDEARDLVSAIRVDGQLPERSRDS